jgi:hypothetical protein
MIRKVLGAAALFAGAGCATPLMTEEQCLAGDWRAAGFEDGRAGRLPSALDERAALCEPAGVAPDASAYAAGRRGGLAVLCTESVGYGFGRSGAAYRGVCEPQSEPAFLSGFLSGRRIGAAERVFERARQEYNNAVSALESTQWSIRRARRTLKDPDAKEKAKRRARRVLESAPRDIQYAEEIADRALYDLGRAEEYLDNTMATADSWGGGPEFYAFFDAVVEASAFARADSAIDHCTDEKRHGAPTCFVKAGAIVSSSDGILCAAGPGEARLARRSDRYEGENYAGGRHAYNYFPYNERGRPGRRPSGFFEVRFDAEGGLEGVLCAPADAPAP